MKQRDCANSNGRSIMKTLIQSISTNSEGLHVRLNNPARLNDMGMAAQQWFISWDNLSKLIFGDQYEESATVKELDRIRHDVPVVGGEVSNIFEFKLSFGEKK